MIDVHAHLCYPPYDREAERVVEKARQEISGIVSSSARYEEGLCVLTLSEKHKEFVFPTIGYHPTEGEGKDRVKELIERNRDSIVGIGEVGLDYHWEKDGKAREKQKKTFSEFIEFASRLDKPLVIHSWDAERECFEMVRKSSLLCVFHCFSGSPELAREICSEGFYVSVSTQVLFSKHHRKIAKTVPLNRLLLETDSPWLSPFRNNPKLVPEKGFDSANNYPWNIKLSAAKIAEIKGLAAEEVLNAAGRNARRVFGL